MTLDEDVAQQIRTLMRERGTGFKETVNELLRRGLRAGQAVEPYVNPTFTSGVHEGIDLDKAMSLVGALEDSELARNFELGK